MYVPNGIDLADIIATPRSSSFARGTKRRVVALDCEMVGVSFKGREIGELAQLCVIYVLTGDLLIDMLVEPLRIVISWRTRYNGLTSVAMRSAESQGRLLHGWQGARAELLKYIDSETILVGQDLNVHAEALSRSGGGHSDPDS